MEVMLIKPPTSNDYDGYTVSIGYVRALLEYVEQCGYAAEKICSSQQLPEIREAPSSARFSVSEWHALMATAESLLGDPCLALTMSEHLKPWNIGLVGFMTMTSSTLEEVGKVSCRYHHLLNDLESVEGTLHPDHFALRIRQVTPLTDPRITLLTIGAWAWQARLLTGKSTLAFDVDFVFSSPGREEQFTRVFGGAARFNQSDNALMGSLSYLNLPVVQQEPSLNRILHQQAEHQVDQHAMSSGSFLAKLENLLALQMGEKEISLVALADALDMAPRTLQNRLEAVGLTFRDVVDRVRKNMALKYLNDSRLSLFQIALMLGFANQSSFHHAFKRWTGQPPGEFRRFQ